jgi:hypothetical protein
VSAAEDVHRDVTLSLIDDVCSGLDSDVCKLGQYRVWSREHCSIQRDM